MEHFDLGGARVGMPADVFLATNQGEVAPGDGAEDGQSPPLITLDGGGQIHIGPKVLVKTAGGPIEVKKGSKLAVSQFAKLITD